MIKLIHFAILMVTLNCALGQKTHNIFWNSTSSIFQVDNTDHIVDVNQGNLPWEYDQVNIICPFNSQEKHVIYSVSKDEFDSCRVSNPRPKIVAICDRPQRFKHFTITMRQFSPSPGGLEFKPGEKYYFISTSNKYSLHSKAGGYCSSNNMKMVLRVFDNSQPKSTTHQTKRTHYTSPIFKAFNQKPSTERPTSVMKTLSPIYSYKSRPSSVRSSEFLYYYSPRDLIQLKIAARKHQNLQTKKTASYRSGERTSSCSMPALHVLLLLVALSFSLRINLMQSMQFY